MERLMSILYDIRPELDFEKEERLIDDSVLDSFDIIAICSAINETFDIYLNLTDLAPKNFNSATAMWSLIGKYI